MHYHCATSALSSGGDGRLAVGVAAPVVADGAEEVREAGVAAFRHVVADRVHASAERLAAEAPAWAVARCVVAARLLALAGVAEEQPLGLDLGVVDLDDVPRGGVVEVGLLGDDDDALVVHRCFPLHDWLRIYAAISSTGT